MEKLKRFVIRNTDTKKFFLGEKQDVWVDEIDRAFFYETEELAHWTMQFSDRVQEWENKDIARQFLDVRFNDLEIVPVTILFTIDQKPSPDKKL